MKAIILCAGRGNRLIPLTFTKAKPLLPVANRPLVSYGIEALVEVGIKEIGIIVGETKHDIIRELSAINTWDINLTYIEQKEPRGLAHAVSIAKDFIDGDDFVMYLGDNIFQESLHRLVEDFNNYNANSIIFLHRTEQPQLYGIAALDHNQVVKVVEKPKDPPSDLAITGVYIFDNNIFNIIDNLKPSWRNELEITDAIQGLIDNNLKVLPYVTQGWWVDAGNPTDIVQANRLVLSNIKRKINGSVEDSTLQGEVIIGEGSLVIGSKIRGPVLIGKNCRIKSTFIGPFTTIGDNVVIENAEIEHSIIMENCQIENVIARIDDSLVGRNVKIGKGLNVPKVNKFVLSDNSVLELV